MANQKPFYETIVPALNIVPSDPGNTLYVFLDLIRNTDIPKNHEAIIMALERCIGALPAEWTSALKKTIESVRAKKEAAKKVVKYKGILNFFESDSFMRSFSQLMNPSHGITEISFKAVSTGRLSVAVKLPTDFNDIIFGQIGLLGDSWNEKLHQVSGPPLPQAKVEKTNILTLPDNHILSFENGRWWFEAEGVDKHEISRSTALEMVLANNLKSTLTNEAWDDLHKVNQPRLKS